jgi:Leishmanolysin
LGFSKSLYQYYINPSTLKRKTLSDTYFVDENATLKYMIRSPLVLAHAKEHFNCSTMQGIPVEDDGDSGSAGSHWEKIVLGNEVMVANTVANPVVSRFSLKLMEDSGWYQINYEMAEPLFWGKKNGCSILSG